LIISRLNEANQQRWKENEGAWEMVRGRRRLLEVRIEDGDRKDEEMCKVVVGELNCFHRLRRLRRSTETRRRPETTGGSQRDQMTHTPNQVVTLPPPFASRVVRLTQRPLGCFVHPGRPPRPPESNRRWLILLLPHITSPQLTPLHHASTMVSRLPYRASRISDLRWR
jgi:hypothetical protein